MRFFLILFLSLFLFSSCVKRADRVNGSTSSKDVEFMEGIYTKAQQAFDEGNYLRAFYLHEKNCGMGYSKSCNRIAYQHYTGKLIVEDHQKAFEFYQQSCKMNNNYGCFNLANMLRLGQGTKTREPEIAFTHYKNNCTDQCYRSCFNLGVMYFLGHGTKKDKKRAKKFFKKACNNGLQVGCDNLEEIKNNKIKYIESSDADK